METKGKMLGRTQKRYKVLKGLAACSCPDCGNTWGTNSGKSKKAERRYLRTINKRSWRSELAKTE